MANLTDGSLQRARPLFDIVCEIENENAIAQDFVILTSGEFIVAPRNQYSEVDLDYLKDNIGWGQVTTMNDIKIAVVKHLLPKERRKVKIRGFNIGFVTKDFSGRNENLWPFLLRMTIRVESRAGESLANSQAILSIIPVRSEIRRE